MEIGVLGPLVAELDRMSVVPNAAKPRQVLALLALRPGRVVSIPTLIEELWGDDLPRTAPAILQTYVLQLRRMMSTALGKSGTRTAKDVLCTRYGGYALDVPAAGADAAEFDRLCASGLAALRAERNAEASQLLHRAMGLWRGPALVDVQAGRVLEVEVLRLEETRLGALDGRIEADLRLGRHGALLGELTALTARHPLHESLHSQLVLALYRCGRPSDALDVYHRLRGSLVRELGMEPSPRLQRLHRAVLAADPALELPERGGALAGQLVG